MNLLESFKIALLNLKNNKMRSLLSMLGVIIGVAAMIVVVSISNGMKEQALKSLGPSDFFIYAVFPKFNEKTNKLTEMQMHDLSMLKKLSCAQMVLPVMEMYGDLRTSKKAIKGPLTLANADYIQAHRLKLTKGRNINAIDITQMSRVCLLSRTLAQQLFYDAPIGQTVYYDAFPFTVIGLVETLDLQSFVLGGDQNMAQINDFITPYSTALRLNPDKKISQINIYVDKKYKGSAVKDIESLLLSYNKKREDFSIQDPRDILLQIEQQSRGYMIFLSAIAGISLLVGGIGIMNVMLTSVAERTREIGVRKAIGACQRDILSQFIVESCVICMLGGCLGIMLGLLGSYSIPWLTGQKMTVSLVPASLGISFIFSLMVGLIFGLFPALRASGLSPAQALRSE